MPRKATEQKPQNSRRAPWRFWIIGGYLLIVVVVAILWTYSLFAPLDDTEVQQQYESLTSIAQAGSVAVQSSDEDAQALVDELAADGRVRVTLIGEDGSVRADSSDDSTTMENHAERPEILAAADGEVGTDRRTSTTDGVEYLYAAVATTHDGQPCYLRVSMPLSHIEEMTAGMRTSSLVLLLIAIVLAILVAWFAFTRMSKPVSDLEKMRTDFVANASHELKTPVTGIQLLSESLEQANEAGNQEQVAEFAERLNKESQRLQHLVADLIDLSRIENSSGHDAGTATSCDLYSALSTSFEGHRMMAKAKGLDYSFDDHLHGNGSCRVALSPTDATLLVDNLLDNAITYTEEGSVTLRVADDADGVVFEVSDSGIGIPTSDQARIFERFYRVDTARSRESGGTGLGLSLVRHVVESAHGTVSVSSVEGEGTTFTVRLPLLG